MLVSAGGTREAIDPVRYITNRSSGKQGHAVAAAARRRGADVVLVTTSNLPRPSAVEVVEVESAAQMEDAMLSRAAAADVVVMAAAVADFRPKVVVDSKLHKSDGIPDLVLEATNDILAELGRRSARGQVLVGFAAETDDVPERARAKLVAKGVDLMVANDVSAPAGRLRPRHQRRHHLRGRRDGHHRAAVDQGRAVADAVVDRVVLPARERPTRRSVCASRAAGSVVCPCPGDRGGGAVAARVRGTATTATPPAPPTVGADRAHRRPDHRGWNQP